ncbi:MAG: DNA alkylation repair protein [Bacteroidales bacterium]|nr:DNA alkylation repair protein [Bacteroidales bacterium]
MAERLKDIFFTKSSINKFGDTLKRFYPGFDKTKFAGLVFNSNWESKELKEKMRHTSRCLFETLPKSYKEALDILIKVTPYIKGFEAMTLPDYVEVYGKDDWDLSLYALGYFTKYSSSEFAIRPFLAEDPERVMIYMSEWGGDKDEKVRRFASEGCRPRLPWAMALPGFKKDPGLILPVLEKLKNDESEFVRRSVANNLNDISKDHPDLVLDICEKWYGQTKNTDCIVRHACRSLLKAGNKRAMVLFGYGDPSFLRLENLKHNKDKISVGEKLHFSFVVIIKTKEECKVRLEYAVYFMKSNGKLSKKVFNISEGSYKPGKHFFSRKHSFINMSTRKHYLGQHKISIIINGVEMEKVSFELM